MDRAAEFRDFIAGLGYEPPQRIEPGRFIRFPTNGKRLDDAGFAKLFLDCEGGIVGDFRTGRSEVWQAKRDRSLSEAERRAWVERIEREKQAAKQEEARIHAEAARQAHAIYSGSRVAPDDHPYLKAKQIGAHGAYLYRGDLVIRDMRCDGALIVPARNADGKIQTVEFISPMGDKRFLAGGAKGGHYFGIGKPSDVLCIAEGFATGASVHEATGHAVAVAFDAGNLVSVAKALRAKFPDVRMILCADDDWQTICDRHKQEGLTQALRPDQPRPDWCRCNPGLTKAMEAAQAVSGLVSEPRFEHPRTEAATDFNDMARLRDREAVSEVLRLAKQPKTAIQLMTGSAPMVDAGRSDWPEPLPLPEALPPVAPFEFALLPDSLQPWAQDICERVQCPPDFVGVTIMAALGAVLGRKVGVRPQAQTDWTETPNQWAFVVGRPGVLKSPAMEAALAPLKRLASRAVESYGFAMREHEQTAKLMKLRAEAGEKAARAKLAKSPGADVSEDLMSDKVEPPILRRYIANDTSAESLGELLRQNPNGLLVFRDELVSLLRVLDREDSASSKEHASHCLPC